MVERRDASPVSGLYSGGGSMDDCIILAAVA